MQIALWTVAALLAAGFAYEQIARYLDSRRPVPGRLIDMGGHRIHLVDRGEGAPTVVLLHGAGETSYSWVHIVREVARFARVVTYDRPGLGSSDPGPGLDAARSVEELHALLTKAAIPAPYVFVGHSIGGILARLYALRFPEQVAGMVMVDSTHEFLKDDAKFRQSFAMLGKALRLFRVLAFFGLPRFLGQVFGLFPMYPERPYFVRQVSAAEYQDWQAAVNRNLIGRNGFVEFDMAMPVIEEAARQMRSGNEAPQFGHLPLVVLTNPGFGAAWIEMHRELAGRSGNSLHRISDKTGHSLQMPRPDLVVDGIRHVVEQARAAQVPGM